jgi:pyruvate/2-oxoglutarate dehydrogenase complex dihydrolipoamide dehydrogenase (E3) component
MMDYDLIVIGNTPEGIIASEYACQLGARVALVSLGTYENNQQLEIIYSQWVKSENSLFKNGLNLKTIYEEILSICTAQNYYKLATLGVDIIEGKAEFCRLPQLALIVNQQKLRSSSYLITTSSQRVVPNIQGIEKVNFFTPPQIYQREDLTKLPENLVIIGDGIEGIILAQKLKNLGKKITLIVTKNQLLPREDQDISFFIQANLEAQGISILTNAQVTQIREFDGKKWIQAGDKALETDELIIATSEKKPNISGLNLENLGVKLSKTGVKVNQKLQTTNPKIYACGDVIGGYNCLNIAQYEAKIAVKNALFFPVYQVNYNYLPYTIFTEPNLARVGLTEKQARKLYGDNLEIINANFQDLELRNLSHNGVGLIKIILTKQGDILGCHLVGKNVGEFIGIVALAMQNKVKFGNLENLTNSYGTYSQIINTLARQWNSDHLLKNKLLKDLLETFFIWKRE